jgi:hypothetical protein
MRNMIDPVQVASGAITKSPHDRCATRWRRGILVCCLMGYCGLALGLAVGAEETAPKSETEQGAVGGQPSMTVGPLGTIEGFRQTRFGMSEEQARQAIRKDFPAAAAKIGSAINPSEKTTVLSLNVVDLLPGTGNARISYIFGHQSKKLIQINIVWTSDGSAGTDEIVVGTANSLRDYFATQNYKPDSVVTNHQLAENSILVFRASDDQKRMVLLVLNGVASSAWADNKNEPRPPRLTLELSYIEDASHPDVFRIGKGQF